VGVSWNELLLSLCARSSSAGLSGKDRDKGKPDGDEYCNDALNPHA